MVSELDAAIGRLTARLEREILDNTLIWFMSDNGGLNASAVPPALLSFSQFLERWFEMPFAPGTPCLFAPTRSTEPATIRPLEKVSSLSMKGARGCPPLFIGRVGCKGESIRR